MRILGGQAVQADRLMRGWDGDPDVAARFVPTNPIAGGVLSSAFRVRYLRTVLTQMIFWPLLVREIFRAHVVHAFSASYSSFVMSTLPAIVVARLIGRPVIVHYHSGEAPDHLSRSRLARAVLGRLTDANVVPSPFLQDVFESFGLPAQTIANTVDTDRFAFVERETRPPDLLSTRNLEPHYHVACTLRAFQLVRRRYPSATLTIVGSGSQEAELRRLADVLALDHVTFTGRVPADDIRDFYARAGVYVQTPDIDNMPLSVLEAFATGCPVVSTRVGGVPALVTDGHTGLLAEPGDPSAVADRIVQLLDNPALARRIASAARAEVGRYTWPAVRESWLALYRKLADGGEAPVRLPA